MLLCYRKALRYTLKLINIMNVKEAIAVDEKQSNIRKIGGFTKTFNTGDLGNLQDGEEFIIPENNDYQVMEQTMLRGGNVVKDSNGNPIIGQYINCQTTGGRIVKFFPSSATRPLFACDKDGRDLPSGERVKYHEGDVVKYFRNHPMMDETMKKLQGCHIKVTVLDRYNQRNFGVKAEEATPEDVRQRARYEFKLVGKKKPEDWVE